MNRLQLKLRNCYGIKALDTEFDFGDDHAFAIYAPNGSMKSSLALTFRDVAEGKESSDRVFTNRETIREITDEHGNPLPEDMVLVLEPYDEVFGHNEKTSTLLVNGTLRKAYEDLNKGIDRSRETLLKALRKQSGGFRTIEREVSLAFTADEDSFLKALVRVRDEVESQTDAPFVDVPYKVLFDEKVQAFLRMGEVRAAIEDYITIYNQLLAGSTYFRRGVFDYHNAATIARTLASNGFFEAQHTISLNAAERTEVSDEEQLTAIIQAEQDAILEDPELRKRFLQIEKLITKNASLRDFQSYLAQNEFILPQLDNMNRLREEIWKSYLKANEAAYIDLITTYQEARRKMEEIETEASKERTQWESVIEMFNDRFYVPFQLTAENREQVILGGEPLLKLGFTFTDGDDRADLSRDELLQVLSTGEKKALYILNILFEVEVRKKAGQETVFVVDDIADSFDYKNKYAIIQYLKDMADENTFKLIILTHNFDFFRTVNSRFIGYSRCLMAARDSEGLQLRKASGIKNVFGNDWKKKFFTDARKRVASIPFIRNIVEYTQGEEAADYRTLTSLLHLKPNSEAITQGDLDKIFLNTFANQKGRWSDGEQTVLDAILAEAEGCLADHQTASLENKVVLAMAIRVLAERFMIAKIADEGFVASISSNQTSELLREVKRRQAADPEAVAVLDKVVLMTPENIHLNSFMYEPILDMADNHLRDLFSTMRTLDP